MRIPLSSRSLRTCYWRGKGGKGGVIFATGGVRSKKKKIHNKNTKIRPTQNTPRYPQEPSNGNHLETAFRNTSHALAHTRLLPQIPCLWKSASTALAISKNDECYTYTLTDTQIDYLNNGTLCAPWYDEAFLS